MLSYKQRTYSEPVEQYMLSSMICSASLSFSCAWVPYYQIQQPIASTLFSDNCLLRLMKQSLIHIKYGAVPTNRLILQKSPHGNSNRITSDYVTAVVVVAQQQMSSSLTHSYFSVWQ